MQYVGKVFSTVSQLYKELNPATLSGAIDVVVVEGRDGEFSCSPFHVRFGKLQLLRPSDKAVQVIVNDVPADFYMKVGDAGEGFFVLETEADVPSQFATSPVASPSLSFRNAEDPDFLDLGGNVKTDENELVADGYVSAPSAHESESGDESDNDDDDVPEMAAGASSSFPGEPPGGSRSSLSLAFTDDMALDIRHRERILHQLDAPAPPRPRASTLRNNAEATTDLPVRGPRHRRLLSAVSDSAYVLDSFAEARDEKAAGGVVPGSDRDDDDDDTGPDGLHTSWDWGVKLVPDMTTALTPASATASVDKANITTPVPIVDEVPVSLPELAPTVNPTMTAVDVPLLVRLAAAHLESPESTPNTLEISLCGADALRASASDSLSQEHVFTSALVHQAAFQADPIGILTNPSLVFRVGGSTYVHGEALVLSLVSHLAFGKPLSESALSQFTAIQASNPSEPTDINVSEASTEAHMAITMPTDQQELSAMTTAATAVTPKQETRRWWRWGQRSVSTQATTQVSTISAVATRSSTAITATTTPIAPAKPDYDAEADAETETDADALALDLMSSGDEAGAGYMSDDGKLAHPMARRHVRYAKTLRLSSAQLQSLNLRRGANDVKFLVPSNKAYCEARIYLYRYDTQIVISDIDGTITKSDALGHLFNMVGKDWTHPGVAKLYTDIANNGYEILYLTSRAIGQADGTRYFISNVKQSAYTLPSGPLLLSPDRLFTSFHREVIMKRPHEFKMACLRDIKNLFGDHSPFYAGFGNRITDAMSYRSVNVPVSRICTIDTYGEIKLDLLPGYKSSYVKINDLVDMMFPALSSKLDPKYNDWEYWRAGLPSIDDDLAEIEAELAREAVAAAAATATSAMVTAISATATTPRKAPGSTISHRLPPNALVLAGAATTPTVASPQSSSLFTRAARAMSNAGTPNAASPLPPSSPGLLGLPAPTTGSRQRSDSWSTTTPPPQFLLPVQPSSSVVPATSMDQVFPALSSSPPTDSEDLAEQQLVPVSSKDSDAAGNESDIEVEDEDEDEDEDELDQDMLAIMHDMDEVQRLQ
ncbi:lipin Ned1 [Coemansia aciculifera]|nr:lipin Ned1 [Coemansia aciculifera]